MATAVEGSSSNVPFLTNDPAPSQTSRRSSRQLALMQDVESVGSTGSIRNPDAFSDDLEADLTLPPIEPSILHMKVRSPENENDAAHTTYPHKPKHPHFTREAAETRQRDLRNAGASPTRKLLRKRTQPTLQMFEHSTPTRFVEYASGNVTEEEQEEQAPENRAISENVALQSREAAKKRGSSRSTRPTSRMSGEVQVPTVSDMIDQAEHVLEEMRHLDEDDTDTNGSDRRMSRRRGSMSESSTVKSARRQSSAKAVKDSVATTEKKSARSSRKSLSNSEVESASTAKKPTRSSRKSMSKSIVVAEEVENVSNARKSARTPRRVTEDTSSNRAADDSVAERGSTVRKSARSSRKDILSDDDEVDIASTAKKSTRSSRKSVSDTVVSDEVDNVSTAKKSARSSRKSVSDTVVADEVDNVSTAKKSARSSRKDILSDDEVDNVSTAKKSARSSRKNTSDSMVEKDVDSVSTRKKSARSAFDRRHADNVADRSPAHLAETKQQQQQQKPVASGKEEEDAMDGEWWQPWVALLLLFLLILIIWCSMDEGCGLLAWETTTSCATWGWQMLTWPLWLLYNTAALICQVIFGSIEWIASLIGSVFALMTSLLAEGDGASTPPTSGAFSLNVLPLLSTLLSPFFYLWNVITSIIVDLFDGLLYLLSLPLAMFSHLSEGLLWMVDTIGSCLWFIWSVLTWLVGIWWNLTLWLSATVLSVLAAIGNGLLWIFLWLWEGFMTVLSLPFVIFSSLSSSSSSSSSSSPIDTGAVKGDAAPSAEWCLFCWIPGVSAFWPLHQNQETYLSSPDSTGNVIGVGAAAGCGCTKELSGLVRDEVRTAMQSVQRLQQDEMKSNMPKAVAAEVASVERNLRQKMENDLEAKLKQGLSQMQDQLRGNMASQKSEIIQSLQEERQKQAKEIDEAIKNGLTMQKQELFSALQKDLQLQQATAETLLATNMASQKKELLQVMQDDLQRQQEQLNSMMKDVVRSSHTATSTSTSTVTTAEQEKMLSSALSAQKTELLAILQKDMEKQKVLLEELIQTAVKNQDAAFTKKMEGAAKDGKASVLTEMKESQAKALEQLKRNIEEQLRAKIDGEAAEKKLQTALADQIQQREHALQALRTQLTADMERMQSILMQEKLPVLLEKESKSILEKALADVAAKMSQLQEQQQAQQGTHSTNGEYAAVDMESVIAQSQAAADAAAKEVAATVSQKMCQDLASTTAENVASQTVRILIEQERERRGEGQVAGAGAGETTNSLSESDAKFIVSKLAAELENQGDSIVSLQQTIQALLSSSKGAGNGNGKGDGDKRGSGGGWFGLGGDDSQREPQGTEEGSGLDIALIRAMIAQSLDVYAADRIGLPDYGLLSAGARVEEEVTSPSYVPEVVSLPWNLMYDLKVSEPEWALMPGLHVSECWAFAGNEGSIGVHLSEPIYPTSVSLDHVHRSVARDRSSAPRNFTVTLVDEESGEEFMAEPEHGTAFYYNLHGAQVQTFSFSEPITRPIGSVRFHFTSNHGHELYTCIYRVRVHGIRVAPNYMLRD
jgi:hypothetical protein